jgi:putative toxin-antitoxin system antitoxin component (TIGR02293 family)
MAETISHILGLRKEPASPLEMALIIQKGLPAFALSRVCERLSLEEGKIAGIVGIPPGSMARMRRSPSQRLSPAVSDRLYRVADLFLLARSVLEDENAARDWLLSPQPGLDDRIPCDLMGTEASAREVEDLLLRVDYGVLAG